MSFDRAAAHDPDGCPAMWSRRALLVSLTALATACVTTAPENILSSGSTQPTNPESATVRPPTTSTTTAAPSIAPVTTAPAPAAPAAPAAQPVPVDRGALATRYSGVVTTQWGTDVAGLTKFVSTTGGPSLALTFDACGGDKGSAVDMALIELLTRESIAATLFLNRRWIDANPRVVDGLMANPKFEIANHGTRHVPLSVTGRSAYRIKGTRSAQEVIDEIGSNHDRLEQLLGRPPKWFRPGTAHYDDAAARIVTEMGEAPAGFAVNGDAGGTAALATITKTLLDSPDGAVVLMHMNRPAGATMRGLAAALPRLRERRVQFVTLTG